MKKLTSLLALLLFNIFIFANGDKTYKINTEISKIEWVGKKVTGSHAGIVMLKQGSIVYENDKITSGEIIIDMTTIEVTDIKDEGMNAKLKKHLVSPDFFGVAEHSTAKLKIIGSERMPDGTLKLNCELTLKGITKRVEIIATLLMEDHKLVTIGEVSIDRTLFGIRYGSGSFIDNLGDKAIHNDFAIKFKVAASK